MINRTDVSNYSEDQICNIITLTLDRHHSLVLPIIRCLTTRQWKDILDYIIKDVYETYVKYNRYFSNKDQILVNIKFQHFVIRVQVQRHYQDMKCCIFFTTNIPNTRCFLNNVSNYTVNSHHNSLSNFHKYLSKCIDYE